MGRLKWAKELAKKGGSKIADIQKGTDPNKGRPRIPKGEYIKKETQARPKPITMYTEDAVRKQVKALKKQGRLSQGKMAGKIVKGEPKWRTGKIKDRQYLKDK